MSGEGSWYGEVPALPVALHPLWPTRRAGEEFRAYQAAGFWAEEVIGRASDEWDQAWEETYSSPPEVIYHYTPPAGLHGILTGKSIWASDARFLNDTTELVHVR